AGRSKGLYGAQPRRAAALRASPPACGLGEGSDPMAIQAPFTLPVEYLDEMGAIAEDLGVPSYPHIVVTFPGRLERDRLARAVRLLVEAEPILGCRFEMTSRGAVWQGRADLDAVQWFEAAAAPDYDTAMSDMFRAESEQGDR